MVDTIRTAIPFITTNAIALLAFGVSLGLFFVHYRDQLERRHGEISRLRSDFLTRLLIGKQQLTFCILHLESIRSSLRTMEDSDDKYNCIENMPGLIKLAEKTLEGLEVAIKDIEKVHEKNTSETLFKLNSMLHLIKTVENSCSSVEKQALSLIKSIQFHQTDGVSETKP